LGPRNDAAADDLAIVAGKYPGDFTDFANGPHLLL
jgi:hypothetical protein